MPQLSGMHERVAGEQLAHAWVHRVEERVGLAELAWSALACVGSWSARAHLCELSRAVHWDSSTHHRRSDFVRRLQLLAAVAPTDSAGYVECSLLHGGRRGEGDQYS